MDEKEGCRIRMEKNGMEKSSMEKNSMKKNDKEKNGIEKNSLQTKRRALAGFGGFLAFMAVCTLITKGIYASGMAKVTVMAPEQRTISHDITIQGTVQPKQEYGIYVQEGLRVETVYVDIGGVVEEGTPLFQVRMEDLDQIIAKAEADIRYQQALLADEAGKKKESQQEKKNNLSSMKEGYDGMVRELDIAIEKKQLAYEAAKREREQAEIAAASLTGGEAGNLESYRLAESQAALEAEEALLQKEEAIREWKRQYAQAEQGSYAAIADTVSLNNQLELSREYLETLQELYAAEGVVCAVEAGIIVENRLQAGEYTPDTACMLYTKSDGTGVIEFVLDDETSSFLSIGDNVNLEYKTASGEKKKQQGVIAYMENENGNYVAKIELAEAQMMMGQSVTLKYQYVSESYSTVISRQALGEENGLYYVYVVEEQEGFLGKEECIQKVNVTIVDSNLNSAAVESAVITADSRIVVSGGKELAEGDVVRVVN